MWKLLTGTLGDGFDGVLPKDYDYTLQNTLPSDYGIGIASIATIPGNDAGKISKPVMRMWIENFYGRLRLHIERVRDAEGLTSYKGPMVVAFEGKRHFGLLYPDEPLHIPFGCLPRSFPLPPGWPCDSDLCKFGY